MKLFREKQIKEEMQEIDLLHTKLSLIERIKETCTVDTVSGQKVCYFDEKWLIEKFLGKEFSNQFGVSK